MLSKSIRYFNYVFICLWIVELSLMFCLFSFIKKISKKFSPGEVRRDLRVFGCFIEF